MKQWMVQIMPSAESRIPYQVAVIGAGASGTLVTAQFNRLAPSDAKLALIGNHSKPALGVAYETTFQAKKNIFQVFILLPIVLSHVEEPGTTRRCINRIVWYFLS